MIHRIVTCGLLIVQLAFIPVTISKADSPAIPYGACINMMRNNTFADMGKCRLYYRCNAFKSSGPQECKEGSSYNWLTQRCDMKAKCQDNAKVHLLMWGEKLSHAIKEKLKNGIEDTGKPVLRKEDLSGLTFSKETTLNIKLHRYFLFKTYYFAVENGVHNFTGECSTFCRVWIRAIDGCDPKELVLEKEGNRTINHKATNLTFGHFYSLMVVYFSDNSTYNFKIGVAYVIRPQRNNPAVFASYEIIPSALLRMNVPENCSGNTSTTPTTISKPTILPSTTLPSSTSSNTSTPSNTSTQPSTENSSGNTSTTPTTTTTLPSSTILPSSTVPATTLPDTPETRQPTSLPYTTGAAKETPEIYVKILADNISGYLAAPDVTYNQSSTKKQQQIYGFQYVIDVDRKGEMIARLWNKKGESLNIFHENLVMEISFPTTNYTFPLSGFAYEESKEIHTDQIFIPAHALKNKTGEFSRKIFSALYLNLNERLPRYFNSVETEQSEKSEGVYQLNSKVIASTAVPNIHGLQDYDIVIKLVHITTNFTADTKLLCAFYKWRESDSTNGVWSTEGCIRDNKMSTRNISVCRCNHLTHFGVLMQINDIEMSPSDIKALRLISYIGCALSLTGAALTVLAIVGLPGARSDRNFIHANLALAIAFAQITFLAGIDETSNKTLCTVVAALLHYFLLSAFSWMLIEGIFLHILIVKVFHDELPKKRYYITFCWGLPAIIVLLSVNLLRDGYGTETSCWLSTDKLTIWTFMGPAIVVMTINIIILCKVMKEIGTLQTSGRREMTIRTVRNGFRSAIILLPLLGITWALGLICVNGSPITFQYLFAIFNSLQGLFIFLFHCLFNTEVRKAFWRKVDLWFTTHHIGSNGHSPSSSKKSKDDHSFSCQTNKGQNRTTAHDNSSENSNDGNPDSTRRNTSCVTNSSYVDAWSQKSPLDSTSSMKSYPGRFSPILADITDIRYRFDQVGYQNDKNNDLKKTSSTPSLTSPKICEDQNGNTHSLDSIHNLRNTPGQNDKARPEDLNGIVKDQSAVSVGIGNRPVKSVKMIAEKLNQNNIRLIGVNGDAKLNGKRKNFTCGTINGHVPPAMPINNHSETKL